MFTMPLLVVFLICITGYGRRGGSSREKAETFCVCPKMGIDVKMIIGAALHDGIHFVVGLS
jgi:hypothetical protein